MTDEVADLGFRVMKLPHTGEQVVVTVHVYFPGANPFTVRVLS